MACLIGRGIVYRPEAALIFGIVCLTAAVFWPLVKGSEELLITGMGIILLVLARMRYK